MRSASSERRVAPGPLALWVGLALAVAIAAAPAADLAVREPAPVGPAAFLAPGATTTLTPTGRSRLRAAAWWGHVYTTATGEYVNVSVSSSYPEDDAVGQGWADYFAGLVHGSELGQLHVYVVTPAEVQDVCGNPDALGCYGSNQLVMLGEPAYGIDPKDIAAHEYGHHVASYRVNTPWSAGDWGTKRWASYAGICTRVAQGTAFPGDEGMHYRLNPGEAFAEVYRAVNQTKAGAPLTWPIVDYSFVPDARALQAAEADVVTPWTALTSRVVQARFLAKGSKVWTRVLPTPLDGQLDVVLSMPKGGLYTLSVLTSDRRTVLAAGLWSGTTQKKLSYTICGQRSVVLRVGRAGAVGRFIVQYTQP